jgi:transposase-like protein
MANKYLHRARISEWKFLLILRLFCEDLNATQIAHLSRLSRNSVNKILCALRRRIARYCEGESPFFGEVEVDESFFGARRKRGKRGRGAYGETIVFGIYKRNGKVYTEVVANCSRKTLHAVIQGKVSFESVVYSDGWRAYQGLVEFKGLLPSTFYLHLKETEFRYNYRKENLLFKLKKILLNEPLKLS